MTAVVTGGAGFVGSHLCEALLADGREVVCVDNFSSGRDANLDAFRDHEAFSVVHADVRDLEPDDLPDADRVYHLASRASPADFVSQAIDIGVTNTEGTRRVLDYAREADARVVYASTSEVYGDPEVHPQPETYTGNVNIRGPRACYDESKRFGEALTVAYEQSYGLDVRTARIFNTYGPRMRLDDGRVVPNFVTQALAGEPLTVYGDGGQTRSFCYVDDTVAGLRALMDAEGLGGDVVNVGSDVETSIADLAERVNERCGGAGVVYHSVPEDDPRRRCPDLTKARQVLGWEPSVSLDDGLDRTIDALRGGRGGSRGGGDVARD
ncbi:NAD-dependent epimerase/dehydratase family protein [Halocalculus aciditolerans]|uniref:NAD-dependent dehydratase n=1 Tax=Halocalculus aciditolerans TaxID=1383812 RepID=A0A830FHB1_9EURY|nr:NAD-dependent epimerase/dehydratase family protein [Halocalculus aciditolerans]GGL55950.1 NAD-dependent dehydratase [Halocalculus aciditolerans]